MSQNYSKLSIKALKDELTRRNLNVGSFAASRADIIQLLLNDDQGLSGAVVTAQPTEEGSLAEKKRPPPLTSPELIEAVDKKRKNGP
jgi:hypothetical protein